MQVDRVLSCHLNFPVPPRRVHVRWRGPGVRVPSPGWKRADRLPRVRRIPLGELFALQIPHGTATALSSLSSKGVEEELAGLLQAEMLKTVGQKLFGVPGRERWCSLMMAALSKLYFSCQWLKYICLKRQLVY